MRISKKVFDTVASRKPEIVSSFVRVSFFLAVLVAHSPMQTTLARQWRVAHFLLNDFLQVQTEPATGSATL